MLKIDNLSKTYSDGDRKISVIRNLSLQAEAGQTIAIMGPSGCGKSTLISCLAGLSRPDQGLIEIFDREMVTASLQDWAEFRARNIGIVFQQFHLVPYLTALENVRLPLDLGGREAREAQEMSLRSLSEVGLGERASHSPHKLSRGECQRVAIARVMVTRPRLLLADEPTASLDRATGRDVVERLVRLAKDLPAALIMVTHDQEMAEYCDEIFQFTDGQLRKPS